MRTAEQYQTAALARISPAARAPFLADFEAFLTERAARYTMEDSASLPVDTATRLAEGVWYPIDLHLRLHPEAAFSEGVAALYKAGVADVHRLFGRGKLLLRQAEAHRAYIKNGAYTETLLELGKFFKCYDADFFAQEIPCSIDYPLCRPVPETLAGIEYVNAYLRSLCIESEFLERFPAPLVSRLLRFCCNYDIELVVNLVRPVLEAAIGRALLKGTVLTLSVSTSGRQTLLSSLRQTSDEELTQMLEFAALRVFDELDITSDMARIYLGQTALDMQPRLRAAITAENLDNIFYSL